MVLLSIHTLKLVMHMTNAYPFVKRVAFRASATVVCHVMTLVQ
jgi:hypothetical protein